MGNDGGKRNWRRGGENGKGQVGEIYDRNENANGENNKRKENRIKKA